MQMEKQKYIERVNANMQEEIEYLQELIRFNTEQDKPVKTPEGEIYPFGKGVQDALENIREQSKNVE